MTCEITGSLVVWSRLVRDRGIWAPCWSFMVALGVGKGVATDPNGLYGSRALGSLRLHSVNGTYTRFHTSCSLLSLLNVLSFQLYFLYTWFCEWLPYKGHGRQRIVGSSVSRMLPLSEQLLLGTGQPFECLKRSSCKRVHERNSGAGEGNCSTSHRAK